MSAEDVMECDLVVIGGGMAGMTAAATAAESGARVIVIEKSAAIGGSAALSGGYVWTATSQESLARHDDGDPALHRVVIEEYPHVMAWMRGRDIAMGPPVRALHGRGYQIDMQAHLTQAQLAVEKADGMVALETVVTSILTENGAVTGVMTHHDDGDMRISCPHVLVATGGFQNNAEWRARHIHPNAATMRMRSNLVSRGEGLELAIAAGGSLAGPNSGYYGHLMARHAPLRSDSEFIRYTQYHSIHGILLNREGKRFVDESFDDHTSSQYCLRQQGGTALLIWDQHVQDTYVCVPPVAGAEALDRFQLAIDAKAPGGTFDSLGQIASFADSLGYDGVACAAGLKAYNEQMRTAPEAAIPPREDMARPLDKGPWYVLEVDSAITFTFCGLWVDDQARALDPHGAVIKGLYAAGADVGNAFRHGYAGGLALAATFAFRAMRSAGFSQ